MLVLDRTSNGLVVAAADPTNVLALDDVTHCTRTPELHVRLATAARSATRCPRLGHPHDSADVSATVDSVDDDDDEGAGLADIPVGTEDAPIVKLVDQILGDAVHLGASDIHLEPQRDGLRVRYRVDGLLRDVMNAAQAARAPRWSAASRSWPAWTSRERRVRRTGAPASASAAARSTRASAPCLPHGEKVVIRLLDARRQRAAARRTRLRAAPARALRRRCGRRRGWCSSPARPVPARRTPSTRRSRRSTTPTSNIVTLEDPVEVQLPGITQVQVSERDGHDLRRGPAVVLRQDPDVILVGEVRDSETAELALEGRH